MVSQEEDWLPPSPDPAADTPFENPRNILLDDVEKELLVLRSERPVTEQRAHPAVYPPSSAVSELSRVLGCAGCKTAIY